MRLSWDCHSGVILVSFESFECVIALELQDFYWCLIQSCRGSIDVASTPVRALSGQKVCVIFSIGDCDFSVHLCHFSVGEPGASVILCNSVKMSAFCQHQIWRYTQYSTCVVYTHCTVHSVHTRHCNDVNVQLQGQTLSISRIRILAS